MNTAMTTISPPPSKAVSLPPLLFQEGVRVWERGNLALGAKAGFPLSQRRAAPCRFRFLFLVLSAVFCLFLAACSDDEEAVRVDFSQREPITMPGPGNAVTYAYLPQYSHTISYTRHHPLISYLEQETGLVMRQVFPATFADHLEMVEQGEIDISFANPFIYLQLAEKGSTAFARIVEMSGDPNFRGQIIVRSDNLEIQGVEDCRGKSWIAVDPGSAGGYLFDLGFFLERGITPDDFSEITFAPGPGGKQEKVVLAVHARLYDLGTIREGTLDLLAGKIDLEDIRVLATTEAYPGWVYSARPGLEPGIVQRLAQAMFALNPDNPEHAAVLGAANIAGIIPAKDADYAPVRELVRNIDASLSQRDSQSLGADLQESDGPDTNGTGLGGEGAEP